MDSQFSQAHNHKPSQTHQNQGPSCWMSASFRPTTSSLKSNIANSAGDSPLPCDNVIFTFAVIHFHLRFHPTEPWWLQCICDMRWWLTARDLKRSSWEKISSCRMRLAPHEACTTPNNWSQRYLRDHLRALGVFSLLWLSLFMFIMFHWDPSRSIQIHALEMYWNQSWVES